MNDLTAKILKDLDHQIYLVEEAIPPNQGLYLAWATFWLTGRTEVFHTEISLDLMHERDLTSEYQQCLKALAALYLELELRVLPRSKVAELVLAERDRQQAKGYTIAHDKAIYTNGNLKYFCVHRITNDKRWYPFTRDHFTNEKQPQHTEAERIIQAAAILLAHMQKSVAQQQLADFKMEQEKEVA